MSNKSQNMWASSELSFPTTTCPEHNETPENQESVLKSYFMKIVEFLKEEINNSLKEIQENTGNR